MLKASQQHVRAVGSGDVISSAKVERARGRSVRRALEGSGNRGREPGVSACLDCGSTQVEAQLLVREHGGDHCHGACPDRAQIGNRHGAEESICSKLGEHVTELGGDPHTVQCGLRGHKVAVGVGPELARRDDGIRVKRPVFHL